MRHESYRSDTGRLTADLSQLDHLDRPMRYKVSLVRTTRSRTRLVTQTYYARFRNLTEARKKCRAWIAP